MSVPSSNFIEGYYTADGNPKTINLGFSPDYIELQNYTQAGSTASTGVVKRAWFFSGMAADSALVVKNTNSAATDTTSALTTGGFTPYDGSAQSLGGSVNLTSGYITQANPAVVTCTSHGLITGNVVRLYNVTSMQQLSSLDFYVTKTGANTFTIPVDTSGFAAAATGGSFRKINVPGDLYIPRNRIVTGISAASSAVITTATAHGFAVNQIVRFYVPSAFAMTQMNELLGTVSAVGSVTQFTVNINSSAFTAFAWPASGSVPFTFAQVVPVGEDTSILSGATQNAAIKGVTFGTSVCGAASDVIYYVAKKCDAQITS